MSNRANFSLSGREIFFPSCRRCECSIATSAAARKILPLPPASAFCSAELYTFSNTRGTASRKVGWKVPRAGSSCLVSGWWPVLTPACTLSSEMNRANTCAVVMNSSVEAPGVSTTSCRALAELRASSTKLLCTRTQPLGRPVDPEV